MKILIIAVLLLISQISAAQVKPFEVLNPQVSQGYTLIIRINPQTVELNVRDSDGFNKSGN